MNIQKKKGISVLEKIELILDAFKDIGKLTAAQLMKGQKLYPEEPGNFREVTGRIFHQAINQIRKNDIERLNKGLPSKGLKSLSVYDVKGYMDMKCFLGINNSSGYCIHGGELVSVFSSQKASADAIMKDAIKNGAKRLDCYVLRIKGKISGPLYKLYTKYGFKIDKSMKSGKPGEPYAIVNGISDFVNDRGEVEPDNPQVVVFMKRA